MSRFFRCASGATAIEFALIAPLLIVILAASVDFGLLLMTRFRLNEEVSSGAAYALVNAERASAKDAKKLAADLTALMPSGATASVVVNKGAEVKRSAAAKATAGASADADLCYCPTLSSDSFNWGSAKTCMSPCPSGGLAGKFVRLDASSPNTSIFFKFVSADGKVSASAVVQVK